MEVLLIGAGGSGPAGADHFAPTVIVGSEQDGDPSAAQAAPFEYIPDPGDASGIAAALDAVSATGAGGWVHIRRGTYSLAPEADPLTVPNNCRVTGDGPGATVLIGRQSDRRVFTFQAGGSRSELSNIQIFMPPAVPNATGASVIDMTPSQFVLLDRVHVIGPGVAEGDDESLTAVVRVGSDCIVQNSRFSAFPATDGGNLAVVRIPGVGGNSQIVGNFIQGGDYEIFADGASGAAWGIHILNNYCLGNANVNTCIALAVGGQRQFVRGNLCVSGDVGILFSANDRHVSLNQCYGQITTSIQLNGNGIACIGNTTSTGSPPVDGGAGNSVANNTEF